MSDERYVHAWLLRLDPAWRREPEDQRRADIADFTAAADATEGRLMQHAYSTIGLRAEGDLLLWRMAESIEAIEESAADLLASGIGRWMTSALTMIGLTRPSQYVKRPTAQEQSLFTGERSRYLVVYPFVKSIEWYLASAEERQEVMKGHMRVGHAYPQVRQLLAYTRKHVLQTRALCLNQAVLSFDILVMLALSIRAARAYARRQRRRD